MTDAEIQKHLDGRMVKVRLFVAQPWRFKVCDQCSSIQWFALALCHVCGAYRFHEDRETVIAAAFLLGLNPFPETSGIVPRI